MDIVDTKGIEKIEQQEVKVEEVKKKRKPRSEAQKAAFEKARLKRAANLAAKKLEEGGGVSIDESQNTNAESASGTLPNQTQGGVSANSPEVRPKAPPKKRGRPKGSKKLKREPVPEVGQPNFLPQVQPPEAGDIRYQYQQPNPYHHYNPMMNQQFQPPPQVHNYYYGHQQAAVNQQPRLDQPPPQRPPSPEPQTNLEESSEEEVDDYLQHPEEQYQEPVLKFRFA
mgnify:FL=1